MRSVHVGIAGAGLVGRTLAWRLLRAGCRVTLFDKDPADSTASASMVAAAMLSPMAELAVADAVVFDLGQRSMALWPAWIEELQGADPIANAQPVYFRQNGTLVLAHGQDLSSLTHFTRILEHKLPMASRPQLVQVDGAGVAALEPALAGRFQQGLHLLGEGQVCNAQWMAALKRVLNNQDVQWHAGFDVDALRPNTISAGAQQYAFDAVVDARGVGSKADLPGLRGVRGEVLRVQCGGVRLNRPVRLMHPRYQLYVAPRPDDTFVVGATQLESEDSGPVTLRSMLELGSALYSLHPAFGEARVQQMSAALRPALDNDQPFCALRDGVWHINGLYRHGYLCAPALVDSLARQLLESMQ